ncbi:MAG: aminotransferase class III [Rickettsiales bacterium]|nr:aminotransferase class III [Rickettsiales bacterium]
MANLGQKYLVRAKKIIPGGNQLLSKRSEIFLPNHWPNYFKKAKGCKITDLENKSYYDFAGMGVTACIVGYSDKDINSSVKKTIKLGSMTTLNSLDELKLAEEILNIHTWAGMAKFCKSGGEACMIAIRIARAYSKKQGIAFCGYHGWHDWYLAANLTNSKNLDKQLLRGLKTTGVSKTFKESIFPFNYNDIDSFEKIIKKYKKKIGIIIMEPRREQTPKKNFLGKIKKIAKKNNIILIFDEITSGFHENLGGIHLKYNVNPDIAIFGKAIANGYPISAIIGKKKIMNNSQKSFISSTMWTEGIGFSASLATIKKMKKYKIQKSLVRYGKIIKSGWQKIAKKNKVDIMIYGLDSIPCFKFSYKNSVALSTYFTQEMLKRGFLANTSLATSFSYNESIINKYLKSVDKVFGEISLILRGKKKLILDGPMKHTTFRRLT